jgi:hypothetical protein
VWEACQKYLLNYILGSTARTGYEGLMRIYMILDSVALPVDSEILDERFEARKLCFMMSTDSLNLGVAGNVVCVEIFTEWRFHEL